MSLELAAALDQILEVLAKKIVKLSPPSGTSSRLLSVAEAAMYLGRTVPAVKQMIRRGRVPVTKIDGKPQFDRAVLDKLIADSTYFTP